MRLQAGLKKTHGPVGEWDEVDVVAYYRIGVSSCSMQAFSLTSGVTVGKHATIRAVSSVVCVQNSEVPPEEAPESKTTK